METIVEDGVVPRSDSFLELRDVLLCVSPLKLEAKKELIFCLDDLPHMFFNVKFNFKASSFSSTFLFERSFRWGNAILVLGVFTL